MPDIKISNLSLCISFSVPVSKQFFWFMIDDIFSAFSSQKYKITHGVQSVWDYDTKVDTATPII